VQSVLVNGKGQFQGCLDDPSNPDCDEAGCPAEEYLSPLPVEAGKTYLFRIINAASLVSLTFAMADHNMTVVRADGTYVEPVEVSSLEVNVGQRYSVLVTADQAPDMSYWATVTGPRGLMGYSYLQYDGSAPPDGNYTTPTLVEDGPAIDKMLFSKNVQAHPNPDILAGDVTPARSSVIVTAQALHPPSGQELYTSNNVSNSLHAPVPLVTLAYESLKKPNAKAWPETDIPGTVEIPDLAPVIWNFSATPRDAGVTLVSEDHGLAVFKAVHGDVIDMVFQNTVGSRGMAGSHAWHLHGHQMYVIGQGSGTFDPDSDPDSYNLVNPVLRDTFSVWNFGWTAIRFKADNPGAWPLHCTMLAHAVTGMGFNLVTSPDLLSAPPPGLESCYKTSVNPEEAQVCTLKSELDEAGSDALDISRTGGGSASESKEAVSSSTGGVLMSPHVALLAGAFVFGLAFNFGWI